MCSDISNSLKTPPGSIVLIVDDEESVRDIARLMLERLGYRVLTADNGSDAVAVLREWGTEIEATLLDMTMPGMDGLTTLQHFRHVHPTIRVVLMSGTDESDAFPSAPRPDSLLFLRKPFRMETLRQALA